jgi:hypothetical protein
MSYRKSSRGNISLALVQWFATNRVKNSTAGVRSGGKYLDKFAWIGLLACKRLPGREITLCLYRAAPIKKLA